MLAKLDNQELAARVLTALREISDPDTTIAELAGVTPQAVHGWKKTGRIDKDHYVLLSEKSGRPLEYFLTFDWEGAVQRRRSKEAGSQSARLDIATLDQAVRLLSMIADLTNDKTMSPTDPACIFAAYSAIADDGSSENSNDVVVDFLRKLKEMRKETKNDDQRGAASGIGPTVSGATG